MVGERTLDLVSDKGNAGWRIPAAGLDPGMLRGDMMHEPAERRFSVSFVCSDEGCEMAIREKMEDRGAMYAIINHVA
jgi:hypothetical protein